MRLYFEFELIVQLSFSLCNSVCMSQSPPSFSSVHLLQVLHLMSEIVHPCADSMGGALNCRQVSCIHHYIFFLCVQISFPLGSNTKVATQKFAVCENYFERNFRSLCSVLLLALFLFPNPLWLDIGNYSKRKVHTIHKDINWFFCSPTPLSYLPCHSFQ